MRKAVCLSKTPGLHTLREREMSNLSWIWVSHVFKPVGYFDSLKRILQPILTTTSPNSR